MFNPTNHRVCNTHTTAQQYTALPVSNLDWQLLLSKGRALDIAPRVRNRRGAQVHGPHQAASHVPALYLPSYSRYSFTDPERMEGWGWVSPGPGCNEQLAHSCYTTARSQRTQTHDRDLAATGRARKPLDHRTTLFTYIVLFIRNTY